jgi:hypothetical protein
MAISENFILSRQFCHQLRRSANQLIGFPATRAMADVHLDENQLKFMRLWL